MSGAYRRVEHYQLRERIKADSAVLTELVLTLIERQDLAVLEWLDGYGNHSHFRVEKDPEAPPRAAFPWHRMGK